MCTKHVLTTY